MENPCIFHPKIGKFTNKKMSQIVLFNLLVKMCIFLFGKSNGKFSLFTVVKSQECPFPFPDYELVFLPFDIKTRRKLYSFNTPENIHEKHVTQSPILMKYLKAQLIKSKDY